MFAFFRPAAHQAPLPEEKIDSTYRRLRWQIFAGIFFGYAGYYLLRKNLVPSTEAFIDRAASQSSMSSKPYQVRCPGQPDVSSKQWFTEQLQQIRANK